MQQIWFCFNVMWSQKLWLIKNYISIVEAGLVQGGGGRIAITQPRRVAAVSVASRVADEIGCR